MFAEWEYKLLTAEALESPLQDEAGNKYGKLNEATLNALGKEGWEVCGYNLLLNYVGTLIMKRKRSTQS